MAARRKTISNSTPLGLSGATHAIEAIADAMQGEPKAFDIQVQTIAVVHHPINPKPATRDSATAQLIPKPRTLERFNAGFAAF
jgi:hypothetical protein